MADTETAGPPVTTVYNVPKQSSWLTKVHTNAVVLMAEATIAAVFFIAYVSGVEGLEKAGFIAGTTLTAGWLAVAMVFTGKSLVNGHTALATKLSLDVVVSVSCALATFFATFLLLDTRIFLDSAAEGVAAATSGGLVGVVMAFVKKDSD